MADKKYMTSKEIRQSFKDFFASKGHKIVPSAPMVIKDDPTLMFTNAGMNQFKDIILGNRLPDSVRVSDSQKCLRVSGKHNDLEEVGRDTYHHTMFEMLGNWSFGDYFKNEAIDWAWEYLVDILGLDPSRLYATVFEGSESDDLGRDDEGASIWLRHLPESHIINGNKHDNFWEMGDTGPCGPCSEIHIDLRPEEERRLVDGATLVNKDNPLVIEIWNLVFMQYNRKADGSLEPLPHRVIDTGMGFERLCMAMQDKKSNYDTDVFRPLLDKIGEISGRKYGQDEKIDIAMRVMADHVRTIAFSIADSQLPSNAKAGYVIRRILRRAVRYAYTFLGIKEPFMYRLIDTLVAEMGDAYPELLAQKNLIVKVIREEEEAFLRTLDFGIKLLDSTMARLKAENRTELPGEDAFTLYDTYGFPLDLTELILRENGMTADIKGFDAAMRQQKERARNAAAIESGDWVELACGTEEFVGYDAVECCGVRILRYRKVKKNNREFWQVILDHTPFYAEMGGQVGDCGYLEATDGTRYAVVNTVRENNVGVHIMPELPANPGSTFTAIVDAEKRLATSCNHSATHLLHEALREVLGSHVEQRGSFVSPESLRFDFSHYQKLDHDELRKVEKMVNRRIREAIPLDESRHTSMDKAREMGAIALFGEKYGDDVRVVRFGTSIELCGGTHVVNTGNIGSFRILSESSIAAGIRRIEAVTAAGVDTLLDTLQDELRDVAQLLGSSKDLRAAVRRTLEENSGLKKQVEDYFSERISRMTKDIMEKSTDRNGIRLMTLTGPRIPDVVKNIAFGIRAEKLDNAVFAAATFDGEKPLLTLMISDDLVAKGYNASNIVRTAAKLIKGGGGGQPFFAQAGGKEKDGLSAALDAMIQAFSID